MSSQVMAGDLKYEQPTPITTEGVTVGAAAVVEGVANQYLISK